MKMNNIKIEITSGNIFFDNLRILPLNEIEFLAVAKSLFSKIGNVPIGENITAYNKKDVKCGTYNFEAQVWFKNGILDFFSLDWLDGITYTKGWDSTDADLIKDKSSLTRFVHKISGSHPERKDEYEDTFIFTWGSITTVGVRKAMYPKIHITWV